MNDHQPPYVRASEDWALTLWGHLPNDELEANLEFMITMGERLHDQGSWLYPDKSLIFIKDEASCSEEEIFWYIKPKEDRPEFAVNYDGKDFYLILETELPSIQSGIEFEEIKKVETALGLKSVMVSEKALFAGYHPPACIHEYCLDKNFYSRS